MYFKLNLTSQKLKIYNIEDPFHYFLAVASELLWTPL